LSLYPLPPRREYPRVFLPIEEEEGDVRCLQARQSFLEGVFGLWSEEDGSEDGLAVFMRGGLHDLLDEAVTPGFIVGVHGTEHAFDGLFVAEGVVPAGADLIKRLRGGEDAVVRDDGLRREGGREEGRGGGRGGTGDR
jgi:hypothetical protein